MFGFLFVSLFNYAFNLWYCAVFVCEAKLLKSRYLIPLCVHLCLRPLHSISMAMYSLHFWDCTHYGESPMHVNHYSLGSGQIQGYYYKFYFGRGRVKTMLVPLLFWTCKDLWLQASLTAFKNMTFKRYKNII